MAAKPGGGWKSRATLADHRRAVGEAAGKLPRLAIAHGESEFLRREALRLFRDAWTARHPDGDLASMGGAGEGRSAGIADLTRELSGGSLFGGDKLVLARQADKLLFAGRGAAGEDASGGGRERRFLELAENPPPRVWLFLDCAVLPQNRAAGKRLAAAGFLIPCAPLSQREIPAWLSERAEKSGKALAPAAADMLARAHGPDPGILAGELEKLAVHAGDAGTIDAEMVGRFMTGSVEFDVFGFANAVEAGDRGQAAAFARRIASQGARDQRGKREGAESSAHKVISMLAGSLGQLLLAKTALARGASPSEFASEEGLWPQRAGRLMETAARFEMPALRLMLARAAEEMRRLHDTGGDPLLSLESMAVALTER